MKNYFCSLIGMVGQYQVLLMLSENQQKIKKKEKTKPCCIQTAYFQAGVYQVDLDQLVFTIKMFSK